MPRGKELTPSQRSRLCELRKQGYSYSKIHVAFPNIPVSTIKTTCHRETQRGPDNASRPRSGAPRKLSEEQRNQIRDAIRDDPEISTQDLLNLVDHAIQIRSLRYLIKPWRPRSPKKSCRAASAHRSGKASDSEPTETSARQVEEDIQDTAD